MKEIIHQDHTIEKIIFFDGDCLLCNATVAFFLKKNIDDLYFATLQSAFAKKFLATNGNNTHELNTVFFYHKSKIYERSDALLHALQYAGFGYKIISKLGWIIPKKIRDAVYDVISRNRARLWKKKSCFVPTPVQKAHIIS